MTIKLLSYNVRFGGTGRESLIASVVRGAAPDVVVFQEATRPEVVERVARETGMETWAARPGHSTAFMSRIPIASHAWHRPRGARHPFLEIAPADSDLRIFDLHLSAIHSRWTEMRRARELRSLLALIDANRIEFPLLVGDFNALAPGVRLEARQLPVRLRPFVWLSGGYTQRQTIQLMLDRGYADGYRTLHPDDDGFTFPTWKPHVRLDYLFVPERHAARVRACEVVRGADPVAQASDHFPLLAQLDAA